MDYCITTKDQIRYIVIPTLEELGLSCCMTTIDMDLGYTTSPSTENVNQHIAQTLDFLNLKPIEIFSTSQIHWNRIGVIHSPSDGQIFPCGRYMEDCDGLMTRLRNIVLISKFADCTPILLFDPIQKVHATLHSGWRGTISRIGELAVKMMVNQFSSKPKDIIAVIGPSIGPDDFEVKEDVRKIFEEAFDFHSSIIRQKDEDHFLVDLPQTNRNILLWSGVKENHISEVDLSTYTCDFLHSYRRDKETSGRMALISCLL